MLTDLDKTLKQLLTQTIPIKNNEVDVQFELPRRDWSAGLLRPTINLYLYDIRENTGLRANEWIIERSEDGRATKKKPPLRINVSYMVTVWANILEDEHRLLWRTLATLMSYKELPPEVLQGELAHATVPIPITTAQPDDIPNTADLWGALDNELKATIHLTVTLPLDIAKAITGPLVLTKRVRVEQGLTREGPFEEIIQTADTARDEDG
jgi:hypothetical protein